MGQATAALSSVIAAVLVLSAAQADDATLQRLESTFDIELRPLLTRYCLKCHSGERVEAEIDLAAFTKLADVRSLPQVWQKVGEMLDSRQMPPKEARQPSESERASLQRWVNEYLTIEARARAGDPGRVVLRRLSNAEYTYTLRDLTGVHSLDPAREFPVDGAAGEGFTNTGSALVMSPALVTKYLDAAKEVASHAVLLPDEFRFSPYSTRRDWTEEILGNIRAFYSEFSDPTGGDKVDLQGVVFDTNQGGRLPLEKYLAATLDERVALASGKKTSAEVARQRGLSPKYLGAIWKMLSAETDSKNSLVLDRLRGHWRETELQNAAALATEVASWQRVLWQFNSVGHIGKEDGPKAWMQPVNPLNPRHELKLKLPESSDGKDAILYLTAGDAGDGNKEDFVVWEGPRLVVPGRPELLLRDVRPVTQQLVALRQRIVASTAQCLNAAAEASASPGPIDLNSLAQKQGVEAESLAAWLEYLGIGASGPAKLGTPLTRKVEEGAGYDFIKRWAGDNALGVVANSSGQHVRIPGNMKPHSIAVHPAPTLSVAVAWRSAAAATLRVEGAVQHAHPECGNGVEWSLELRRGNTRQSLAAGTSRGERAAPFGPLEKIAVQRGDVVALVISPRNANHSCDLTAIDLTLDDGTRQWSLARDLSPDILGGNPHADSHGNPDVWHFFSEPVHGAAGPAIPAGSLLARWQAAGTADEKQSLAQQLQLLLQEGAAALAKNSPDYLLHQQLTSLGGPLLTAALQTTAAKSPSAAVAEGSPYGLDPALFGRHPSGALVDAASLCVKAPSVLEVRLPADLVAGAEFLTAGTLHAQTGSEGSAQFRVLTTKPDQRAVLTADPIVVMEGSAARRRLEAAFDEFRQWFPAALCYTKIVPVDEVITLTLFYREDDHLQRLMLDDEQVARLNRLWDELHYVSHDALLLVDAYAQQLEYATQVRDPKVFEPLRKPINDRAVAFRRWLTETEPQHLDTLLEFAGRAYRRPLTDHESQQLRVLYGSLRQQEIPHDEAIRLTLARVLVAPAFLYHIEKPHPGTKASPVSDWELASRLSYFLWSSQPDEELRELALAGRLSDDKILVAQTRRMLRDAKTRRLAIEFACQWLHIHDFDHLDEKSERHFPTFTGLRSAMYEESIQFFTDFFQNGGPVLSILDADHTFLNEELAKHYGIPSVTGEVWRRVDGVKRFSRGGILTQATTLTKQSGASRTSPILRGNWLNEVVLGQKLPRPPSNVPQLADAAPAGLTERQLIERHSSDATCMTCHARIDPFGFALENFDAIGRFREKDAGGLAINSRTTLPDGTTIQGLSGLKRYLLTTRRDAFVRQFNRKLLGYALGRSVQLSDEPLLTDMHNTLNANDYRISSALELIVRSRQFREIRGREMAFDN